MRYLTQLSSDEACDFLLKNSSYFDGDIPEYINFNPVLEAAFEAAKTLHVQDLFAWKPQTHEGLNYILQANKDGKIAWRPFELTNPLIYAKLVHEITLPENWKTLCERLASFEGGVVECTSIPVISDTETKDVGEQILNWWKRNEQRSLELSLEYTHSLMTDVTNCYPSIYTHSIAWAIHGKKFIKKGKNRNDLDLLGNKLDKLIQYSRNGQTNGIPQASVLSHLIAETLLGYCDTKIDEKLSKAEDIKIIRYRDDYRIFGLSDKACEDALKVISEQLNAVGLQLGKGKTTASTNVVSGAVKPDKLAALALNLKSQTTLQKQLLLIHRFVVNNPGSGSTKRLMKVFLERLKKRRLERENPVVLSAVMADIARISPNSFPPVAMGISKILNTLTDEERGELFRKILVTTNRIPNNGFLDIWLQRIALPSKLAFKSKEKICKLAEGKNVELWNFAWIGDQALRNELSGFSVVDLGKIASLAPVISFEEFDVFWTEYG